MYTGQFWNVPIEIEPFTGILADPKFGNDRHFTIKFSRNSVSETSFTGFLQERTWNHEPFPCLYAGNRQGGPISEVSNPNNPVIEGSYKDYFVPSVFSEENYKFRLFDDSKCSDKSL